RRAHLIKVRQLAHALQTTAPPTDRVQCHPNERGPRHQPPRLPHLVVASLVDLHAAVEERPNAVHFLWE
ncbi:MAG: hypothetical protein WA476_15855, partial [Acidobacteriaceae bacterium]